MKKSGKGMASNARRSLQDVVGEKNYSVWVDMIGTQPIEDAFEVLEDYIDRLESPTSQ